MRSLLAALAVSLALPAGASAKATWSPTVAFDAAPKSCHRNARIIPAGCFGESAPRAAVNVHGAAIAAWVNLSEQVRVSVADKAQVFEPAVTLGHGLEPAVAISPGGTATVVWESFSGETSTLKFAQRPHDGRFGTVHTLTPAVTSDGDDGPRAAAAPDGAVEVVFERASRTKALGYQTQLVAVHISPGGQPGPATVLGYGRFGHDSVRAGTDGSIAACCLTPTPTKRDDLEPQNGVAVYNPATGWSTVGLALSGQTSVETVALAPGHLAVGAINATLGGDAGELGIPGLLTTGVTGQLGQMLSAPVVKTRGLQPVAAIDGSLRPLLVYQEKTGSSAFSRAAPVHAALADPGSGRLEAPRELDRAAGYEPLARALGTGAIVAWQDPGERWRVDLERGGRFSAIAPPGGPGPDTIDEDFNYDRDLASAGRFAVLTWTAKTGSIRVSELRLT